ncbi:MAG TPA: ABC transporter permease [Solirubrobacteraceae bacterium]|jgi:ABC-2 type transport system permease protein
MSDALTLSGRCLRLTRRNAEALTTSLALPVMLMLLFVYLFGGAIETGTKYVTYVVPGVLLLCAGYGASITAVSVAADMAGGIVDRFRSLDVSGAAVLAGHVTASVVRNAASTVLVLGVGLAIGFRPHADVVHWLGAAGMLALFVVALSWFAAVIGLVARSPEGANGFTFFVMFLPYPSSAFVPVHTMPAWIHGFAAHQPVTPVIETIRSLLLGTPAGSNPLQAVAWCVAILVASVALAGVLFRRRTA